MVRRNLRRPLGHPQIPFHSALLGALALGWMMHAGCVSLDFPPERTDSGAGGTHADVMPSVDLQTTGGSPGADTVARDAADAPDVPTVPGTGGIELLGSGGVQATGGSAGQGNGTGGAGGTAMDVGAGDAVDDTGGWDVGAAGAGGAAGGGGSGGGSGGTSVDALADVLDAPASDVPPDAPVAAHTLGLVVYLPCEAADGSNLQDKSGAGNSGQIVTTSSGGYRFEKGKIGNGLALSQAQGAHIRLTPQVFKWANSLTIAMWINLAGLTTWQRLFDVGVYANLNQNAPTGTAYFSLVLKDFSDKMGLTSSSDGYSNAKFLTTDLLPTGVWKHVAIVASNGGATIYIDGNSVATTSSLLSPPAVGAIDYAFVGKSQFTGDPSIEAQIDEFRVYDRALSAEEVRALFEYLGP